MNREKKEYNIGLDIGTSSVGWAVVEKGTQKIMRKNKKRMWGVRLFEPALTAEERRVFRSTRRRYDRRRERIRLLQEEFKEEIDKVDPTFFQKLKESFYNKKDTLHTTIPLSEKEKETYHRKYPTIYHLRQKLIESNEQEDIRLVYLAIHHIIKYRGNFLYPGKSFSVGNIHLKEQLQNLFEEYFYRLHGVDTECMTVDYDALESALFIASKVDRTNSLKELLKPIFTKEFSTAFTQMVQGNKFDVAKLFNQENESIKLGFMEVNYIESFDKISSSFPMLIEALNACKDLYDNISLVKIFGKNKNQNLSSYMVQNYAKHKKDLQFLKDVLNYDRKVYRKVFKSKNDVVCLYELYLCNKISSVDFCKKIQKYIESILNLQIDEFLKEQYLNDVQTRLENDDFLPRITDISNGKFPYQLNSNELIEIIKKQSIYYSFLANKTENGEYKLTALLSFRIPYYVGPLVSEKESKNAWLERKIPHVKITPYNFDQVVNKELTAEKFITRMIRSCTYLLSEKALPANSILYSEFKVLNELKQIRVNGASLSYHTEIIKNIYRDLFLQHSGSITDKVFKNYIHASKDFSMYDSIEITGYSAEKKFANTMQSYIDFFGRDGIFENTGYSIEDAEEIIEWITIFEDKEILLHKVKEKYTKLSEKQVQQIISKNYKGWGNLSKKLLTSIYYEPSPYEKKTIIDILRETGKNFMQILCDKTYQFQEVIDIYNTENTKDKTEYEIISELATSPATKKGIYQSLKIIREIVQKMGYEPSKIMIEMARNEGEKVRTVNRKQYIEKLYEAARNEMENYDILSKQLATFSKIDGEKLFLYFIQGGKSLYSGEPLEISKLGEYEVDHIIPRTLIKDDSIDNKALVLQKENQKKAASFVVPSEFRKSEMIHWWNQLKKLHLISNKKFNALTRSKYSDEDIQGFINRQLVETRQISKHVANILARKYSHTQIVYLHADLSHSYRMRYDLFKFREINDYHHAHDAYLAAVLGEYKGNLKQHKIDFETIKTLTSKVYDKKDYYKFQYGYVINSLDVSVNKELLKLKVINNEKKEGGLFDAKRLNLTVADNLLCNDILISRKTEIKQGAFYNQTIYSKHAATIPLKEGMPTSLYGGYKNMNCSYLVLIAWNKSFKMIGIPITIAIREKQDPIKRDVYIREHLQIKEDDSYQIVKDYIPFNSLLLHKGQHVYIKGYSIQTLGCEISNAHQLKIKKEDMLRWKYTLNEILNHSKKYINHPETATIEMQKEAIQIIQFLFDSKKEFPLFIRSIEKIESKLDLSTMSFVELMNVMKQLFTIYHCNSVNGDLKEYGLGDRIGRLSGKNITEGVLIHTSITGLYGNILSFQKDMVV